MLHYKNPFVFKVLYNRKGPQRGARITYLCGSDLVYISIMMYVFLTEVLEEATWMTVVREMKNYPSQSVLSLNQLIGLQKQSQSMELYQKWLVCDTSLKIYLMLPCVNHDIR